MDNMIINVAKDFSRYPAGRYISDGPYSGELFREKHLLPVIQAGGKAIIELDGARGYGSSFLEEAFGGLTRKSFSPETIKKAFTLKSDDKSLIEEIEEYIEHGSDTE
jgi:hypothetical protein